MKLYKFEMGPYPRRVLVYLREKGIGGIDMQEIDLVAGENREPAFLTVNPAGSVPVLELDDGSRIRQSLTIIEHLETLHPEPPMLGRTDAERARTRDQLRLLDEAYGFNLMCTMYASPLLARFREQSPEVGSAMRWEALRVFGVLEALAGDGPFLGGERPSAADVVLWVSEQYYRELYRLVLPAEAMRLRAAYEAFSGRPSAIPLVIPPMIAGMGPIPGLSAPAQEPSA